MHFGPHRRHDHLVCKEIADDLRAFAAQSLPFHEWFANEDLPGIFFCIPRYLNAFDVVSGKLLCVDFTPSSCVRGPEVHYHQVDEAGGAIASALLCSFGLVHEDATASALRDIAASMLRDIAAVLALPSRTAALDGYIADMKARGDALRTKGTLVISESRMSEIFIELRTSFSAEVVPTDATLVQVDYFFRQLYLRCEEKKDTPMKPANLWVVRTDTRTFPGI